MKPGGGGDKIPGELEKKITADLGSAANMKEEFIQAGVRRQSIWDRRRRDLVEDAAHLTADFMRRSFGVASGDFGLCLV